MNRKFIVSLNVLLGIILVMSILFLVRDVISNHFEKKSSLKKDAGASSGVAAMQRKMQFLEYAPLMKNNPFGISVRRNKTADLVSFCECANYGPYSDRYCCRSEGTQLCRI